MDTLLPQVVELLKNLIRTPSFSREENGTAQLLSDFFQNRGIPIDRSDNNLWAANRHFDPRKPSILLNSHHDTVKPNAGYTRDPFEAAVDNGCLYGLGSNDAGGPLVSLIAAFVHLYDRKDLKYNLILAATAEEEISGPRGISSLLEKLPPFEMAIVGEPTGMRMAVAEKALMVVDAYTEGVSGHAAREEGVNAIYRAVEDISWIRNYRFAEKSEFLGEVKMNVTMIDAGTQHNVIPDRCHYVIDIRTTEKYTNAQVLDVLRENLNAELKPRSMRFSPSFIPIDHPIVEAGIKLGLEIFGSPTLSDQALISVPSLKIGPGDSARSHSADEFIRLEEIEKGIEIYIRLLESIL